ncbi:hypothetical protein DCAR_0417384 [Daucus carota subsp. sativus]|uniref:Glutaredoxin domain-containing protein n=1 Tax=Daucus carota subsp. sativus TaxID=79200 RepID=A0A165YDW7_DAUCS|nr:PREDICTED: uncharacterized protein At5g39865-like [Daucus carota subsp. sativus]WOG98043.1 hypothetical protein DCAR_0417384 [Daucus carota subsp. sativus]
MGNSASAQYIDQNPNSLINSQPNHDSVINNWELIEVLDDFDFHIVQHPKHLSSNLGKPDSYINGFIKKTDDSPDFLDSYELVEHVDSNLGSIARPALTSKPRQSNCCKDSNFKKDVIVLYYTSMRGIRKTYEDCCQVRMILKSSGVLVDERDVSMDSKYRKELQNVFEGKRFSLPQVFIGGRCLGGADEIKQLHEDGELAVLLEGFPIKDPGLVCRSCGDARFVLCHNCNGSRKYFQEGEMKMCLNCNENGLIHCPGCCS